jgi:hypothetical protein
VTDQQEPRTMTDYKDIIINNENAEQMKVVGEFVKILK